MTKRKKKNNLFNNPFIENAKKAMTPAQIAEYKKMGEALYSNIDFQDSKVLDNLPPPVIENVAYLSEALKSGLLPSALTSDERKILEQVYGKEWFKKFDYDSDS